jgi:hypothetical protein
MRSLFGFLGKTEAGRHIAARLAKTQRSVASIYARGIEWGMPLTQPGCSTLKAFSAWMRFS